MTIKSLFCDLKENPDKPDELQSFVSLGRITFWILLGFMIHFWLGAAVIPPTLIQAFNVVLLYNFLKKPLQLLDRDAVKEWLMKSKN